MQKDTKIAAGICAAVVGLLVFSQIFIQDNNGAAQNSNEQTVVIEDGLQIITIAAKGGYSPQFIEAQGGIPTKLRVTTNGTYDCSSSLVIPDLNYSVFLKPTGTEIIDISADQAKGTLDGTCGMGMYSFKVAFE